MEKLRNIDQTPKNHTQKSRAWLRPAVLIIIVLSLFILARVLGLGQRIGDFQNWIESLGFWGIAVFILIYIAGTIAAVPGSAITVVAGALFGSIIGIILVSIASTVGALLCFLISRYFARDALARMLSSNASFQRLDTLTEKHGAVIVALTRLVPLFPFNILNYGFGLTKVKLKDYVFWSWLCMLPGTVLFVAGADAVTKALAQGKIPWPLVGVAAGMAVIIFFLVKHARRKLSLKEESASDNEHTPGEKTE